MTSGFILIMHFQMSKVRLWRNVSVGGVLITAMFITLILNAFVSFDPANIRSSRAKARSRRLIIVASGSAAVQVSKERYSSVMPWLNVSYQNQEMYLLSAFWDDRSSNGTAALISALVLMKLNEPMKQLYCVIACEHSDYTETRLAEVNMASVKRQRAYSKKSFDGNNYLRLVIPCPTAGCYHPLSVTITSSQTDIGRLEEKNSVAVEYPAKGFRHEFGICVPPIFGCLDPENVVEWMEIQKMFGVSKVIIHNNSQCAETSRVFEEYARQGLVELRQDKTVLPCDDNKTFGGWHMPMSRVELFLRDPLMLTDCMYRHMYDIKHLLFIDLDEILVPQRTHSLRDMLTDIERTLDVKEEDYYQLTFKNFFFLVDDLLTPDPADHSLPAFTHFVKHRKRLGPSPGNKRRKSLVIGGRCYYVHNHECPAPAEGHISGSDGLLALDVPADIGKVHHYRENPCLQTRDGRITCQDGVSPKPIYNDNTMFRFRHGLLSNTRKQRQRLGLQNKQGNMS